MNNSFSIHYRITKRCNANCDYCSSSGKSDLKPISVKDFKRTIDFLVDVYLPMYISDNSYITLNYLGGEVLTLKKENFLECIEYARKRIGDKYSSYRDGIQTNLIGSERLIREYRDVFGTNIGTSVDNYSGKRKIGKSSVRYNKLMNDNVIAVFPQHPPSTFVVDDESAKNLNLEYLRSQELNYDLVLRPIIKCGSNKSDSMSTMAGEKLIDLFDEWLMKGTTRVEPFYSMLNKKIMSQGDSVLKQSSGCHLQNNCIENNVNIDPDGKIYLCNEMADAGIFQLGDAIGGQLYAENIKLITNRVTDLNLDCITCEHFSQCRGGCMYTGYETSGNLSGKDPHCYIWKNVFDKIDTKIINNNKIKEAEEWLKNL